MGVFEGTGKIRVHDGGGLEVSLDGGVTWTTVGGGGFGANVTLQQANASGALVNTLNLLNQYSVNTAGSETADWDVTVPVGGVQTPLRVGRANLAGPATATTASGTPTVVFPPRASALQITMGQLATKLVVTGLNLAADLGYDFTFYTPTAPAAEIDLKLNDTDATGVLHGYVSAGTLAVDSETSLIFAFTHGVNDGFAQLRDRGVGNPKGYKVTFYDSVTRWDVAGHSTLTANVTSISLAGVPSGSVLTISKILPSIA